MAKIRNEGDTTSGLADAYLLETSSTWTSAGIGVINTAGEVTFKIIPQGFEEQEVVIPIVDLTSKDVEYDEGAELANAMVRDPIFRQLIERGMADLEGGRLGILPPAVD